MEINPFVPHVLNGSLAPNIAKFLRDALTLGIRPLGKWDWGSLDRLPFLPAIKYGRTRLSPAKWILRSVDLVEDDWDASFDDWRRQWNVPDRIKIGHTDQLVSLDLRIESHRRMLRESLSGDVCTIYESRSPEGSDGWLVGPGGSYEAEIVVPLYAKLPERKPPRLPAPRRASEDDVHHTPGGRWISVHLYCSIPASQEILQHRLPQFLIGLESLIDQWFFIRYTNPVDRRPHIRLRMHGDPRILNGAVLERLHSWNSSLTADGLCSDVSLQTYRPEVERYGGVSLISHAEDFFCVARYVLNRLPVADYLDVAADVASLIRAFHADTTRSWEDWVLDNFPKTESLHAEFTVRRREALARIPSGLPSKEGVASDHAHWISQFRLYSAAVQREAKRENWIDPSGILRSVVHMH